MLIFGKYAELLENKKTYLDKYAGEDGVRDVVERFWTLRHRCRAPENDIDWWIKKPFADLKKFVDGFDQRKRSERRSDAHAEKAKKYGAVLMDTVGGYEIWYVPSYEAAVELGRFYKNVSTSWCISTDDPQYFDDRYSDSEFMFLIHEDPENCPDEDLAKLALQVSKEYDDEDEGDYKLWDASDYDMSQDGEYLESDLFDVVGEAMGMWSRIPYNRDQYMEKACARYVSDAEWLRANVFYGCGSFELAGDGSALATFGFDELSEALSDGRGFVPPDTVKAILEGDRIYDWNGDPEYDLRKDITAKFDEKTKPYGLSWAKIRKIAAEGEAPGVKPSVAETVEEMLEDDFYQGLGYDAIYKDCEESGALREAGDDIMGQLRRLGVTGVDYGQSPLTFKCAFSKDDVKRMVKLYRTSCAGKNAFQLMAYDEGEGTDAVGIEEPYYGWSGFDEDMMKEAVSDFADRLIGRITMTKDLPGQTYFDFDKDYLDNPNNLKREK